MSADSISAGRDAASSTAAGSALAGGDAAGGAAGGGAGDIEAIKRLKSRYFRWMDTKRWDDFALVFAEDAVMDMSGELERNGVDGAAGIVHGRESIRDFVKGAVDAAVTAHHGHMPEIQLTGDSTAEGVWAMFDFVDFGEGSPMRGLRGYGHYYETYEKDSGGEWRIKTTKLVRLHVIGL